MTDLAATIRLALDQLLLARNYALDVQRDPWEFAVEIEQLIRMGISISELRWMVVKGYVEHAEETTAPNDSSRTFQPRKNLAFSGKSCLILAESSLPTVEAIVKESTPDTNRNPAKEPSPSKRSETVPFWDVDDRTLFLGKLIVKEYRVRSPNQEAVLSAFEEEEWPRYIDDPLPPMGDQNPKQRLRDTIKCLNANQKNRLIRFRGDGTGERVRWELM